MGLDLTADLDIDTPDRPLSLAARLRTLYGIGGYAPNETYTTPVNGGEAGLASGFGLMGAIRVDAIGFTYSRHLFNRSNTGISAGYLPWIDTSSRLSFGAANGAATAVIAPTYQLTASDVGRILTLIGWHDGSKVRLAVNRHQQQDGTAITGYTPASATFPTSLGNVATSIGVGQASSIVELGWLTFRGVPTIQSLGDAVDYFRRFGNLPNAIAGVSLSHRWSVRDQLRSTPPPSGKQYGARAFTAANYITIPSGACPGSLGGFSVRVRMRHDWTPANNSTIFQNAESLAGTKGISFYYTAGSLRIYNYATAADALTYTLSTAEYTLPYVSYWVVFTGAAWRLYKGDRLLLEVAGTYAVPNAQASIGIFLPTLVNPCSAFTIYEVAYGTGVPSQADITAAFNADSLIIPNQTDHRWVLGAAGGVPAAPVDLGTASPVSLSRVGTLELSTTPAASVPPSNVEDTATGASGDRMGRSGTVQVVACDLAKDGRKTLGACGWSASNGLNHATACPGDVAGFAIAGVARLDAGVSSANRDLVSRRDNGSPGWEVRTGGTHSAIYLALGCTGGTVAPSVTVPASDLGMWVPFVANYTGGTNGTCQIFWKTPYQQASAVTVGTFVPYTSGPFMIGRRNVDILPADAVISEVRFAHIAGGLTFDEVRALFASFDSTGKVGAMPSRASQAWGYDLTLDIQAAGGDTVPATATERVAGVDNLSRTGGLQLDGAGVRGFDATHLISAGLGLRGAVAGHWFELLVTKRATTTDEVLASDFTGNTTGGWYADIAANSKLQIGMSSASAAVGLSSLPAVSDGLHHIAGVYDGTKTIAYLDGVQVATSPTFTYVVATTPLIIGAQTAAGAFPATNQTVHGISGGNAIPTPAEIATAAAAALAQGKVVGIPGKTDKRWSMVEDTGGTALPRTYAERVAGVDIAVPAGQPLQVGRRTERAYGSETSPILNGLLSASDSDYLSVSGAQSTFFGSLAGYWSAALIQILSQANSRTRSIFGRIWVGGRGFELRIVGACAQAYLYHCNAAGSGIGSPLASFTASDVGKLLMLHGVYDGPAQKARLFLRRVEQGSGSAAVGYSLPTAADQTQILKSPTFAAQYCQDVVVYGVAAGVGVPTLAQIQAHHDAVMAAERMVEIPNMTDLLVDCTTEIALNSGVSPAAYRDLKGGPSFTRNGAPAVTPQYGRSWAW